MTKLIFLKGLQASGKSTWAKAQVADSNGQVKRVNKDDLRAMIDPDWTKEKEHMVIAARDALVATFLEEGFNVIVDDTNFNPKMERGLRKIAQQCFAEFEVVEFDADINTCIERDSKREGKACVGEAVIRNTYKDKKRWAGTKITVDQPLLPDFVKEDNSLPDAIIVDVDGTLAHMKDRSPYDFSKVGTDEVDEKVAEIVRLFHPTHNIIIFSGRDDSCLQQSEEWLISNNIPFDEIYMRSTGDKRNDAIVKKEMFDDNIRGNYNVDFVMDDRDQVVKMWRRVLGLKCLQVEYGAF